jgi:hypothetical protein
MPRKRQRPNLTTPEQLDRRTVAYRRAVATRAQITTDLGGDLSALRTGIVDRLVVLGAMLQAVEVEWMSGMDVDLGQYAAGCGHYRRLAESLGLDRVPRAVNGNQRDLTGEMVAMIRAAKARRA